MPRRARSNTSRRSRNAVNHRNNRANRSAEQEEIDRESARTRRALNYERNRQEINERERLRRRSDRARQTDEIRLQQLADFRERRQEQQRPPVNIQFNAFRYDPSIDYAAHASLQIGQMSVVCVHCNALKFQKEAPGLCCLNGKVKLPLLLPPPDPIHSLLYNQHADSTHFLNNIKMYNDAFQMTSFGAEIVNEKHYNPTFKVFPSSLSTHSQTLTSSLTSPLTSSLSHSLTSSRTSDNKITVKSKYFEEKREVKFNLLSTIQVHGQIYHRLGSLLPDLDEMHKFLQIYFVDNSSEQAERRNAIFNATKLDLIDRIQTMLHTHNDLIKLFKSSLDHMPTDNHAIVIKADKRPTGSHERQFNAPTADEISIVVIGENMSSRDIILQRRTGNVPQRINETHRSYDGLQYPLMFCRGEDGYHLEYRMINPTNG